MNGNKAVQQNIPIPKGFEYVTGQKINGFVIRNTADGSEFTWFPADMLEPNGTLDGKNFCKKFGRRKFYNEDFSKDGYHERVNLKLIISVKKHGGCYVSRYVASKENGKPVFRKNKTPWVEIPYCDARDYARAYAEGRSDIESCEVCGAAWDSIMQWIIQTAKTKDEVLHDSTSWGNYSNTQPSPQIFIKTGNRSEWEVNHIADLAGNLDEWTSEEYGDMYRVIRGGNFDYPGFKCPAAKRDKVWMNDAGLRIGFRMLLYVK